MTRSLRFRLRTLFIVTIVASCALWAVVWWHRVPMTDAVVYNAICKKLDWESLGPPVRSIDGVEVKTLRLEAPEDLFADFSLLPVLWGQIIVNKALFQNQNLWQMNAIRIRHRPVDRPIDRQDRRSDAPDLVSDVVTVAGQFMRPIVTNRLDLNFDVELQTQTPSGDKILSRTSNHISYSGPAQGNIIVFAIPIDEELVHLVIIDVTGNASNQSAKGKKRW